MIYICIIKLKQGQTKKNVVMSTEQRTTLRQVMNMAWSFIKNKRLGLSEALKLAWANAKLKTALKKGVVEFAYRKLDGTIRRAIGTLSSVLVPPTNGGGYQHRDYQTYFDIEKGSWRRYSYLNVIF